MEVLSKVVVVPVIILNWDGWEDTFRCIQSVLDSGAECDIWLIDNHSKEDRTSEVRDVFPEVRVMRWDNNFGWAGGYNRALKIAAREQYKFAYLLNNDCTVTPGFLSEALRIAVENESVAAVGSRVQDQIHSMSSNGRDFDRPRLQDAEKKPDEPIIGAGMLVRMEVMEKIGYFDERFFCYWEETEWCLRARDRGWRTVVADRSEVFHSGRGSDRDSNFTYYIIRNAFLLEERALGGLLPARSYRSIYRQLRAANESRRIGNRQLSDAIVAAIWDGFRGRFGQRGAPPPWVVAYVAAHFWPFPSGHVRAAYREVGAKLSGIARTSALNVARTSEFTQRRKEQLPNLSSLPAITGDICAGAASTARDQLRQAPRARALGPSISRVMQIYLRHIHIPRKFRAWDVMRGIQGDARLCVRYGPSGWITLHEDDWLQRFILVNGHYEPEVWATLAVYARGGDVVWDAGAFIGTCAVLAMQDGRVSQVHCFEPNPVAADILRLNLSLNGEHAHCHEVALSDDSRPAALVETSTINAGMARLDLQHEKPDALAIVECLTIDHLVFERGLPPPTLLKIDVEDWEARLLRGARALFSKAPPRAVVFESACDRSGNLLSEEIASFLDLFGYRVSRMSRPSGEILERENYLALHSSVVNMQDTQ